MANNKRNNVTLPDFEMMFRNFRGVEGKWNKAGQRNFCALLTPDQADALKADGWNVRCLPKRDEDSEEKPYLPIEVSFKNIPPTIVMKTTEDGSKGVKLDEEAVSVLADAEIVEANCIVSPYDWEVNGKSGRKAYLKTLYVTIHTDPFYHRYLGNDIDDA